MAQGDPNLFKIFLNDIAKYIDLKNEAPQINNLPISYLLYADDVVLLAKTESGLQKSIQGIEHFCLDWGIKVNTSKSKVLVFNKKGKFIKTNIHLSKTKLEDVQEYKYLGILFHNTGKFQVA